MLTPELSHRIFETKSPYRSSYEGTTPKWLFCCSAGLLRSPTAARVAQELYDVNARSCCVHQWALIPFSMDLAVWADKIVFMDESLYIDVKYAYERKGLWDLIDTKSSHWQIPDRYEYMNSELVGLVKQYLRP